MGRVLSIALALAMALTLCGCQQLPPSPEDLQAKKFEAVPDKAVIYLVRDAMDLSDVQSQIRVGDKLLLKTYPGTYYRWEVPAGMHTITG
jgi:starvation-inducible outer membrane lipoprotein